MISEQQLEEKMKHAKPKLPAEPAFTARVMDQLAAAPSRKQGAFSIRRWSLAVAGLALIVGAAASVLAVRYVRQLQPPAATASTGQLSANGSQPGSSSKHDAAYYRQLAASAQADGSSIAAGTGSFSDSDYSDSLLADSAVF